uniref:Uncharacterized protein n=1 Tax=Pavo cristatus TaxID=9049 RepID=A0A8C9FK50_PAVCR
MASLHPGFRFLASWAVIFLLLRTFSEGGKLLVIPIDGSHWLSMRLVVERLRHRGHEIVVVAPEINLRIGASMHYTMKTYSVSYTREFVEAEFKKLGYKNIVTARICRIMKVITDSCRWAYLLCCFQRTALTPNSVLQLYFLWVGISFFPSPLEEAELSVLPRSSVSGLMYA